MNIFLIGPGGVGKSTCGKILADLLGYEFIDLDVEFCNQIEEVNVCMDRFGYEEYCFKNSELFYKLLDQNLKNTVVALSSGFLIHENLDELTLKHRKALQESGISILLLPAESLEESIEIVVRRQLARGFNLRGDREREKIVKRFPIYKELGDIKIFSHEKPEIIASQMKKEIYKITSNNIK